MAGKVFEKTRTKGKHLMGMKCDKFLLRLKSEYEDKPLPEILKMIPEKYHRMLAVLWNHFQSLEDMIDSSNSETVFKLVAELETDDARFTERYRQKDCLQQILRENFFDTLLIIQNVNNALRYNLFQVVPKDQILSIILEEPGEQMDPDTPVDFDGNHHVVFHECSAEDLINQDIWNTELPVDQKYIRKPIVNLQEQGLEPVQHPK